ncbi:MAG: hypothetical protein AAF639_17580 [Chloroflexota bacterium]
MTSITLWALESPFDKDVVGILAEKMMTAFEMPDLTIRTVHKVPSSAKRQQKRKQRRNDKNTSLVQAVRRYLQVDDFVIFVLDTDGPISASQRRRESNSLINQVEKILNDREFANKVFLAMAVTEIESWLLTDCAGIFHEKLSSS